jgi:hypothetical protein
MQEFKTPTHDVTHAMALILKHELFANEKYQSFLKDCNQYC